MCNTSELSCNAVTLESWDSQASISETLTSQNLPFLMSLFWPFMTDSSKTGWDRMAGQSESPILLLSC